MRLNGENKVSVLKKFFLMTASLLVICTVLINVLFAYWQYENQRTQTVVYDLESSRIK